MDRVDSLSYRAMMLWSLWSLATIVLFIPVEVVGDEDGRAGCSTAVNDLVYIVDGSGSVGLSDFDKAKQWLINITSRFDISSHYTQVAVVQYSDTPRLEIPLGKHQGGPELIQAIQDIVYLGGNTQTGRAIKFAVNHVFTSSRRSSQVKNCIAVVITDGKSQDDVVDASMQAQAQGITVFAVGVGSEVTPLELVSIANKPSSSYVLYAEDYTTIDRIRESMEEKLCEESVCPTRIRVAFHDEKGFELMVGMKIEMKGLKIPGSLMSTAAYALTASTDITENTREIFPEGLPPSYVFVATLRLKGSASKLTFDLWRVLSKDNNIQVAVTLSGKDKTVTFTSTSKTNKKQSVIFRTGFQALFDERWHQFKLLVRPRQVSSFLDDHLIQEVMLEPVEPIYISGKTQVAKRRGTDISVPVEIQKLRLYCDPHQSERETACEIFSVNDERCPLNRRATLVEDQTGRLDLHGPSAGMGFRGEKGRGGLPGPEGKPGNNGKPGDSGSAGLPGEKGDCGPAGQRGEPGLKGNKGDAGEPCLLGEPKHPGPKGIPGEKGEPGPPGEAAAMGSGDSSFLGLPGANGPKGEVGPRGWIGEKGDMGPKGNGGKNGDVGHMGAMGPRGFPGLDGLPGHPGQPGYPGKPAKSPSDEHLMKLCAAVLQSQFPALFQTLSPPASCEPCQSIKGPPGQPGLPGQKGSMGLAGYPGSTGSQGYPGTPGQRGHPGHKGYMGPRGLKGAQGEGHHGPPGPPGQTGLQGPRGSDGVGQAGSQGIPGNPGPPGDPGKRGSPGTPGFCDVSMCYQFYHIRDNFSKGPNI
ncbi:collagen alpha-1(XXI) chain [Genypterus blacodes]|uniref:collagen alpha-1(XXI) chain n=1 Tax=Genypterus blacodes TaxID=154954 RepID=UPI003F774E37